MLNQVYRLVSERRFESFVVSEHPTENDIVVKPSYLSICHADQRYYGFKRKAEVMQRKLPMALIHEGVGVVAASRNKDFKVGDRVVFVPNLPVEKNKAIAENYLESSKFRSSSFDGLMQEYIVSDASRLVKVPEVISGNVAAFIEMLTVSYQAIKRLKAVANDNKDIIGVWGDGNLSYMISALLKHGFPESVIYVFGHHRSKLNYFSFVDKTFLTSEIPNHLKISHAIEATGGMGSQDAINQVIDHLYPQGSCVLMGVSEDNIAINTRMILQKGLTFIGSSRSTRDDFLAVVDLLSTSPVLLDEMNILVDKVINVSSIEDAINAFDYDQNSSFGKTIMRWQM